MPSITELRKKGLLNEALSKANSELAQNPNSLATKHELCWVLEGFCKQYAELGNVDAFVSVISQINMLIPISQEVLLGKSICWRVRVLADECNKRRMPMPTVLSKIFDSVKILRPVKSKSYSVLFSTFVKYHDTWPRFVEFCNWWNFENFNENDFRATPNNHGKTSISLVERAYVAYAKAILKSNDKNEIIKFSPLMETLSVQHPEMVFANYYNCKLLLAVGGNSDKSLNASVAFTRKRAKDYWAWQLLAESFPNNSDEHLACLLRSFDCKIQDKFAGRLLQQLVSAYISRRNYAQAKRYLGLLMSNRSRQGLEMNYKVKMWSSQPWFATTIAATTDDKTLNYIAITNKVISSGLPSYTAVVTRVNPTKGTAIIVYGNHERGFFSYRNNSVKPLRVGQLIEIWVDSITDKGFVSVVHTSVCNKLTDDTALWLRKIKGTLRSGKAQNSWSIYADDGMCINVLPQVPINVHIGDRVDAALVLDYNLRSDSWHWTCFALAKVKQ